MYVSLRTSKPNVEAGDILRAIFENPREAGGHGAIAGGSYPIDKNPTKEAWQKAEMNLQTKLFKKLRRSSTAEYMKPFPSD